MSELGETSDPRALVPGAPEAVYDLAAGLRRYGSALEDAGENLRRISSGGWTGTAAVGFQDKFAVEPARWLRAADAFTASAVELDRYADVLAWAQAQAREAIARYEQGEQATAAAQAAHDVAVERAEAQNAANAIRYERQSGETTHGRSHIKKAEDSLRGLENWLHRNPDAPASERAIAAREIANLRDALGGK